jgi:dTDP-glucose pyrophosphorylase
VLKIIIPIAGPSETFVNAGYYYPKPLVEIKGKTMIEWVLQNPTTLNIDKEFIFIIKEEEATKFHLDNTLKLLSPNAHIVKLKRSTKGGLCSVLMAIDIIDSDDSILILNGDQIIDENFKTIHNHWEQEKADAGLVTFNSVHPRWSYARIENDEVVQTAEKNPISKFAIAGYYYFKQAEQFFTAAFKSIYNDVQTDGSFYISPVLNQYVLQSLKVKSYNIPVDSYHSFYTPQLIQEYERRN